MIKVGLLGTGYIGGVHLEALARIGGVKVTAVSDVNLDLANKAAARFNIEKACNDPMEIIKDRNIDVIHNCTPNKFHYILNREALNQGKHILSEKPLSMTSGEAEELVNIAVKKGAVTGVDFCYRYYPVVQEMAVRIRRGECGDVRMATGSWFQDWLCYTTDYSWRLDKSESGESNITADLGSHWFDLIQFVTGLNVTEVLGDLVTIIKERKKPKRQVLAFEKAGNVETETVRIEVDDYSCILFRLSNGAPGSFTTSQLCQGRKSTTEFQIYGSQCSFAWDHRRSNELWIGYRDKPNETLVENAQLQDLSTAKYANLPAGHPLGYHDAVLNLFKDYYEDVKNGGSDKNSNRPTFCTGYDEMKILDAVLESKKNQTWAEVK
ncbi:MAG: Gfo/Idh/MocA family oxidoreductase [Spirochaetota bacterium]